MFPGHVNVMVVRPAPPTRTRQVSRPAPPVRERWFGTALTDQYVSTVETDRRVHRLQRVVPRAHREDSDGGAASDQGKERSEPRTLQSGRLLSQPDPGAGGRVGGFSTPM